MDLIERIEHLLERTMSAVKTAAEQRDVSALQDLAKRSMRLNELEERAKQVERELRELEHDTPAGGSANGDVLPEHAQRPELTRGAPADRAANGLVRVSNAHRMEIEVTQGMINQNLLTLTEHVNAGRIRTGCQMSIEAKPSEELFNTELLSEGNRLRERAAVARFYHDARVRAGDTIALVQHSPNRWILEKVHRGSAPRIVVDTGADDQI